MDSTIPNKKPAPLDTVSVDDLLDALRDGFFELDSKWIIRKVNSLYVTAVNTRKKDHIGKNLWELFPDEATPKSPYWRPYHEVMQTRKPAHFTVHNEPANSWTEFDVYPTRSGGISIFFRDITERKHAELELKKQNEIIQAITNHASAGLFMLDKQGLVTYMNPVAARLTGFTTRAVLGRSLHALIHHSRADGSPYDVNDCALAQAAKQGTRSAISEDIFFRKDGTPFPAIMNITPIVSSSGEIEIVVDFRDISEEKRALEKVKRARRRQDKLQKTADVLHEQREELLRLNDAKDEFISLASHQLRTPATTVKQYLGMLIDGYGGALNDPQQNFAQTANAANERQLRIVDSMLKVARVDAGKFALQKEIVDAGAFVQAIIDEQNPTFAARNQTVQFNHPTVFTGISIDTSLFRMVIENIIDNAQKYSPEGTSIQLSVEVQDKSVCINVKDSGDGISAKDSKKLFKKFSRLDNAISIKVPGSGLGLYWAKRVVELHNGIISVTSKPGSGAMFTVQLAKYTRPRKRSA